jgi:hypothetical protein
MPHCSVIFLSLSETKFITLQYSNYTVDFSEILIQHIQMLITLK